MDATARHPETDPRAAVKLWLRLYRPVSLIERELRSRFQREFGVSLSRFDALSALDRAPDGLLMGELSDRLLVTNGNVTGLISRMVADGLATRAALPQDRRSFRVELTDAGRQTFARMARAHADWLAELLADLPGETAAALGSHTETLMHSLRTEQDG
ncbi:MarR family winged helix-turn-helix transcriptional regulator [Maricaulis maris]|uniref:MarR family transcriptional regulator n=1 Tax=Maricaulis maris TaxID=74318 RepID=A0A495DMA0_9PROT|nr:MarR family transcriptional regulator [Maricaulis maris]RKR03760.1 MarR family transcriptional regulator [Maricaulis maris]